MKKYLVLIALFTATFHGIAQDVLSWRLGVMALPHNGWFLTTGLKSTSGTIINEHTPQFTFNTNFGIVAGLNFTDFIGVEVNAIFGKFKQEFNFKSEDQISGSSSSTKYTIELSKTDIPVLLKAGGLMYFEVGPQITMISKVETVSDGVRNDVSEDYEKSQMFVILGTGAGISIPKIARIELGLRLGYGVMDISAHRDDGTGSAPFNDESVHQAFWGIKIAAVHKF